MGREREEKERKQQGKRNGVGRKEEERGGKEQQREKRKGRHFSSKGEFLSFPY